MVPAPEVMRLPVAQQVQRAWLPLKIYPISAGVKGGLAGGVAMALLAMLYGLIFYRSIWYPDQPACRKSLRFARHAHDRSADALPLRLVPVRARHAHHHVPAGGTALRRDASHAADPPHRAGRNHRSAAVDGIALSHPRIS